MERQKILDRAEEEATGYWEVHQGTHLSALELAQVAEQDSHKFVADYQQEGDAISEEERLAYRTQFAATYLDMERIDADMRAHPKEYGITVKQLDHEKAESLKWYREHVSGKGAR